MSQEPNGKIGEEMPDTEVVAKAKHRQFTAEYKLRILRELDGSQGTGETGALLRREGFVLVAFDQLAPAAGTGRA